MKRQKGFTFNELLGAIFYVIVASSWIGNAYKLTQCDFEPSYKAEIVHLVGLLFPVASIITVWHEGE